MKQSRISFCIFCFFLFVPFAVSAQKKADGFESFYAEVRSAVNTQNKTALKELMAGQLVWGKDGEVSRVEAVRRIGEMITWKKFWQSAKKAVAKNATRCKSPYCENRSGYRSFAPSTIPV